MRRMLVMAGVLGLLSAVPAAAQVTIDSYTFYQWTGAGANNHWYALTGNPSNWWNGEVEADALASSGARNPFGAVANGYQASLHSAAENAFIIATFGTQGLHIGAFQAPGTGEPNSDWQWTSGEAFTYSNWSGGEPNDLGGEDYVSMNWGSNGSWNDHNGGPGYRGLMEFEAIAAPPGTVTPEPVTMTLLGTGLAGIAAARRRRRQA
jgi:hypothetical protein